MRCPPNMCCVRVKSYTASKITAPERHNERKNNDYGNVNVDVDRIPMNVHFKDPGDKSYMELLRELNDSGRAVSRGLRQDAKIFDELVFDVNTTYFEYNGGYEFAKKFYKEVYNFVCEKYGGEDLILSAVMHADEINLAVSEELGKNVYHYHMHVIAVPVVEKKVLWTKRCKDPELVGKVKCTVNQISHSKKWESRTPMVDVNGNPVLRKNGKPRYVPSYSLLQDEYFNHMVDHGFKNIERGKRGSTVEHLTSLQYQIKQERDKLNDIKFEYDQTKSELKPVKELHTDITNVDKIGKKTVLGKYTLNQNEYEKLTTLAKDGIYNRKRIKNLEGKLWIEECNNQKLSRRYKELYLKYEDLLETCEPFLTALNRFPELVKRFVSKVKDLLSREAARNVREIEERERGYERER